ncbi:MAG: efflux transporter outer membrane subunit [Caulobacteraceae bacterium]
MKRIGWALCVVALLAGCKVGPNYRAPPLLSGKTPAPALIEGASPAFEAAPLPSNWWRLYDDPQLDALVAKALVHNTDLRVALASLEQVRDVLRETQSQRTPQTTLNGYTTYGQESGDANGYTTALKPGPVYDLTGAVSYDLDLFGRLRRAVEAGRADVGTAQAALDLARVNVAGQTAAAYAGVCATGLQIQVVERSIALAQTTLGVTQRRVAGDVAGVTDVVQARALLRQTQATLPSLQAQQRADLYTLATLTGDPPEAFPAALSTCTQPPLLRRPIPIGDGTALLKRRPDVREAERKLASSVATIGVTTSQLYPSVTLGGMLGTTATSAADIVRNRAFEWSLGPMVSWTFPNLATAKAEIAASNATARGDLASFDGTVLTALRETETALVTLARQLDTERDLSLTRDDAATANRNITRLYQGGVGEFLDTLDAERTLISADNALASATAQVSQDQITLFMALGGGWENAPAVAETPLTSVESKRPAKS